MSYMVVSTDNKNHKRFYQTSIVKSRVEAQRIMANQFIETRNKCKDKPQFRQSLDQFSARITTSEDDFWWDIVGVILEDKKAMLSQKQTEKCDDAGIDP